MSVEPKPRTVVVGAGCAGLAFARTVADAGEQPTVIDKARGVGGRCATRRFENQPVDFGALFYHGSRPAFLDALKHTVDATAIEGWPAIIEGSGPACLSRAFEPHEQRLAFREGMTAFPKSLARGLDLRLGAKVSSIELANDRFELTLEQGEPLLATSLVLALPVEQARPLIEMLPPTKAIDSARSLLNAVGTDPCLTLIAGYPLDTQVPSWDICYPDGDDTLLLAAHDSRKRSDNVMHAFVYQCSAAFSRAHLEADPSGWIPAILERAASCFGSWARTPALTHPHRWRFGRANGCALSEPLVLRFGDVATLSLIGELFDDGLGVEGAFTSGLALAERLGLDRRT